MFLQHTGVISQGVHRYILLALIPFSEWCLTARFGAQIIHYLVSLCL